MMSYIKKIPTAFKSKRVWVIVAFFVFYGIDGIREHLPAYAKQLDILLLILGAVFGIKPDSTQ